LILASVGAMAAEPEGRYLEIFTLIETADSLSRSNLTDPAKAKYREAHAALLGLKRDHPTWNPKVVTYRLNYVSGKLTEPAQALPATSGGTGLPEVGAATRQVTPAPLPAGMEMKLLDSGAEPRRELRFRVQPGDRQSVSLTTQATMGMGSGTAPAQMTKMPAMTMTLTSATKSVSAAGDINYEMHIEDVKVAAGPGTTPELVEAMNASILGVKGLVADCTVANRGFNKQTAIRIPAGVDAEMRASMEAIKEELEDTEFVLPHEAIGVGARWEIKQKVKSSGMAIDQTTTLELVAIEGDLLTVKSSTVQQAARQRVPNPMVPQAQAELVKLAGSGGGNLTIDLTRLLPVRATIADHSEATLSMEVAGQKQTLTMKTDSESRLEAK
jgi:hypothetical protein